MKDVNQYQGAESKKQFNVGIIGSRGSGKTTLMHNIMKSYDRMAPFPNIYCFPYTYEIEVETAAANVRMKLIDYNKDYDISQIVQTVQQNDCSLIVCDLTNKQSIDFGAKIIRSIKKSYANAFIYLIGTKIDIYEDTVTTTEKTQLTGAKYIEYYAKQLQCPAITTSSQTSENIDFLTFQLADQLSNPYQKYSTIVNTTLDQTQPWFKKYLWCCFK